MSDRVVNDRLVNDQLVDNRLVDNQPVQSRAGATATDAPHLAADTETPTSAVGDRASQRDSRKSTRDGSSATHDGPSTRRPRAGKLVRGLRRSAGRIPRVAWTCALVAFLNAACWSLITPPFQAPDEPSHFAYVQGLAERGGLPASYSEASFSPAEDVTLEGLKQGTVRYSPQNQTISAPSEQRRLEAFLALPLSRVGVGAGVASSEPPLYYALETIPYFAGSGGTILDSLALMRLFSALAAAVTALFVFLFLREALPGTRWAWTVGGLGVAFAPLLGFISGAVNPDALLCAVSAALFYCLARGFRRGLTPRLALATGLLIAAGALTKLNFVGLVPGVALGLALLTARARRTTGRTAYRELAIALAAAAGPVLLYVAVNLLTGRSAYGTLGDGLNSTTKAGSAFTEMSYIWQFYLPRLPGMHTYFPGFDTTRGFWIDGFVGLYGWLDTTFPAWVYEVALVPLGLLAALLVRCLLIDRRELRHRAAELTVYGTLTVGLMTLVAANDYLEFPANTGTYAQPRYLLPLIALYGAALALAARGAGRRWGPVVGAAIVILLIGHDVFSQLLVISRYYG